LDNSNPFPKPPIAANFYNNPPMFCYGRDNQDTEIAHEVLESLNSPEPKLIRILGKQGIGKSTLICWSVKKISTNIPLIIVYLETSGQPEDFKMKSLYRQLISKASKSPVFNDLLINSVKRFIKIFTDSGGTLYSNLSDKFSGEVITKLISDIDFIKSRIEEATFTQKLFELINNNAMLLSSLIPVDITFLLTFWKAHVQNPEYLQYQTAFRGEDAYKGFNIETDGDASKYIDEFIELIRWSFDENTTLVVIFDHLEAGTSEMKEKVYSNLFTLLLNLRQKKYITLILSGTLDAYNEIDEILEEDQNLQLDNWAKTIALTNLKPEIVIQIVNQYLSLFWGKFNFRPPPDKSLFPFGTNSIQYLYENNGQDLRKTLKNLYELIERYRISIEIQYVDTFFKAFKVFRLRDDMTLSYIEQRELRKKILDSSIQDKQRSTIVELAIYEFFNKLKNHPDYDYLTDVLHEPALGPSGKRPDIFLEYFGKEGTEKVLKVGIEVKMYRRGTQVSKKDIKKTYILLEEKSVDYIIWITNVPLDIKYRYDLPEEIYPNLGRFSPLDDLELAYISFMVYFKEIFGDDPSVEQAEFILNKIDLSPIEIRNKLLSLPKLTEVPVIPKTKQPAITDYGETTGTTPKFDTATTSIPKTTVRKKEKASIEVGLEQIISEIQEYMKEKAISVTRITSAHTIKAVKEKLHINQSDDHWNEDIWTNAIAMGKEEGYRTTTKTIFFT
jgi:hypothetical protein